MHARCLLVEVDVDTAVPLLSLYAVYPVECWPGVTPVSAFPPCPMTCMYVYVCMPYAAVIIITPPPMML